MTVRFSGLKRALAGKFAPISGTIARVAVFISFELCINATPILRRAMAYWKRGLSL